MLGEFSVATGRPITNLLDPEGTPANLPHIAASRKLCRRFSLNPENASGRPITNRLDPEGTPANLPHIASCEPGFKISEWMLGMVVDAPA